MPTNEDAVASGADLAWQHRQNQFLRIHFRLVRQIAYGGSRGGVSTVAVGLATLLLLPIGIGIG